MDRDDTAHSQTSAPMVLARALARRLGIQTGTLAKWRQRGVGPQGWIRLSATAVAYPVDAVERWLAERQGRAS